MTPTSPAYHDPASSRFCRTFRTRPPGAGAWPVLEARFLEYLQGLPSGGLLFLPQKRSGPNRKLNWYLTRRSVDLRRALGIDRERVGFHSFRKAVATKLERARIPESKVVQVLGHEKMSMSYVYSLDVDLRRLREIVEAIGYGGI